MNLKKGDLVKLISWKNWLSASDHGKTPLVWGGPHGYRLGTVLKTVTGSHNKVDHHAVINFNNGELVSLHPDSLELAAPEDKEIAFDSGLTAGPVVKDIWVLLRTSSGNFSLNVIECLPFGDKDVSSRYVVGFTKFKLPTMEQNDYNLISYALQQSDWSEKRTSDLFTAANQIHMLWDLPPLDALPLPLPEFDSIREAADCCPNDGTPAILFFHTPHSLVDFSEHLQGVASNN